MKTTRPIVFCSRALSFVCLDFLTQRMRAVLVGLLALTSIGTPVWTGDPALALAPPVSMRVHAVFVSDDNGGRKTAITPSQVQAWVDKANEIYTSANIHLDFDPSPGSGDYEELRNTLINSMSGAGDANWIQERNAANAVAATTPHDMVTFFRWGPDPIYPTGAAFSGTDYNFIAATGFNDTYVAGHQNIGLFAHEAGHYLGLAHTFGPIFNTVAEAQNYYVSNGSNPAIFDGDGRADTAPDPFVTTAGEDASVTALTLGGTQFQLPRSNIMSYYEPRSDVSPSQAATMRQALVLRSGQSLTRLVDPTQGTRTEGEGKAPSVTKGFTLNQPMDSFLGKWSSDAQLFWSGGSPGSQLSFPFRVPAAGKYEIYGGFTSAPDFGIHTHIINGQSSAPLDLFSRAVLPTGAVDLGAFDLKAGVNEWRVQIKGSNPMATPSQFGYGLDYVLLIPVAEPAGVPLALLGLVAAIGRRRMRRPRPIGRSPQSQRRNEPAA